MGIERKRKIYQICQRFNLLIMEDDPYWNIRFDDTPVKSFLSMDKDGRVLRFDSFSKIISSGMRIGWITGPATLVDKIQLDQQVSNRSINRSIKSHFICRPIKCAPVESASQF